jgi:hypothetical protein
MFKAAILACMALDISSCYVFFDNRGPYETQQLCHDRIAEMSADLVGNGFVPQDYRCQEVKGEITLNESNDGNKSENSQPTG